MCKIKSKQIIPISKYALYLLWTLTGTKPYKAIAVFYSFIYLKIACFVGKNGNACFNVGVYWLPGIVYTNRVRLNKLDKKVV